VNNGSSGNNGEDVSNGKNVTNGNDGQHAVNGLDGNDGEHVIFVTDGLNVHPAHDGNTVRNAGGKDRWQHE
jgi:hypothetical protein